jgi:hypothetical protein
MSLSCLFHRMWKRPGSGVDFPPCLGPPEALADSLGPLKLTKFSRLQIENL